MPAFFAHYQFGEQVVTLLDDELQELIAKHKKEFRIGLQGPDVFFFYRPWKHNDVVEYGNHLHETPARWMFQRGMSNSRYSAAYAYMLGVVCHFALDSMCHPYIDRFEKEDGVPHLEIESEFEKMLLRRSGKDPFTYRMDLLIPTDEDTAYTIYDFYHVYGAEKMHFALRWMQNFRQLFTEPSPIRQGIMNFALDITGFGKYKGQILQLKDNKKCTKSNAELYQISLKALPYAVELIKELDYCKQNGEALGDNWDKTFA